MIDEEIDKNTRTYSRVLLVFVISVRILIDLIDVRIVTRIIKFLLIEWAHTP